MTTGPRPLRLASSAESPTITSPTPLTPTSATLNPNSKRNSLITTNLRSTPRRQSSISYNPPSRDGSSSPAPFSPRHAKPQSAGLDQHDSLFPASPNSAGTSPKPALIRSASVGGARGSRSVDFSAASSPSAYRNGSSTPTTPGSRGNRNSTGSLLEGAEKDRPPLTLAEKHADLLHFIAQKESKCLELRLQLSAHEAELLQLKKKWERIISRGFERSQQSQTSPSSPNASSVSLPTTNATHPPSASIYSAASLSYLDNLSAQAQGAGSAAMLEALGGMKGIRESVQSVQQGVGRLLGAVAGTGDIPERNMRRSPSHTPSLSSSSASTYTTSSTRLSQSSQSSFGDFASGGIPEEDAESSPKKARKNRPQQIAIVSDTGATPLVSPTRDFAFDDPPHTAKLSRSASGSGNMRSRRKSRNFSSESPSEATGPSNSEDSAGYGDSDTNTSESLSASLVDWGLVSPTVATSGKPPAGTGKKNKNANKRMSLPARALSSGDGGGTSWMGSMVGKSWEDTISKNQKRASLLFSDVSQSIVQALVSPPLTSENSQSQTSPWASTPKPTASSSAFSLLDEDIPSESSGSLAMTLEPSPAAAAKMTLMQPTSVPKPKSPMKSTLADSKASQFDDDDDDWNW